MIFNGEMVRAILDGRKTQTRRPYNWKRQPAMEMAERDDGSLWPWAEDCENSGDIWIQCPFGEVGDRIWVRETFGDCGVRLVYQADNDDGAKCKVERWTPSIHMPRWASRILLEITGVRVERLNGISETEAEAEGIDMDALADSQDCYDCIADHNMTGRPTAKGAFKYLWESIYGEENWQANPWVWVIEFKVVINVQDNPA